MGPFSPAPAPRRHRTRRSRAESVETRPTVEHAFDSMGYRGAMDLSLQGSLLDLTDAMTLRDVGTGLTRHHLAHGAWVDVRPGWLAAGDELFTALLRDVPVARRAAPDVRLRRRRPPADEVLRRRRAPPPPDARRGARGAEPRTTPPSSASRSSPRACASTATAVTAWPGTATASDALATATR